MEKHCILYIFLFVWHFGTFWTNLKRGNIVGFYKGGGRIFFGILKWGGGQFWLKNWGGWSKRECVVNTMLREKQKKWRETRIPLGVEFLRIDKSSMIHDVRVDECPSVCNAIIFRTVTDTKKV